MYKQITMLLAALALATPCWANSPSNEADDTQAIEQATAEFYSSLNALFTGEVAPMEQVWSHADDVSYMGPAGGMQIGWEEVRAIWEKQAALKLGGQIEPYDVHINVGSDLATVQCYEMGSNLDAEGRPESVSIRATNVYRKENGQWKMIGHHTDLLPSLEARTRTTAGE